MKIPFMHLVDLAPPPPPPSLSASRQDGVVWGAAIITERRRAETDRTGLCSDALLAGAQ